MTIVTADPPLHGAELALEDVHLGLDPAQGDPGAQAAVGATHHHDAASGLRRHGGAKPREASLP